MDKIFGREELISLLQKRIDGFKNGYRQNIALIAGPSMGKTFIINRLLSNVNPAQILPIFMELKNPYPKQIIYLCIGQILRNFLAIHNAGLNGTLKEIISKSQVFLPKTIAKFGSIEHNLAKDKEEIAFLEMFDLMQVFCEESSIPCLVILDEFQNLAGIYGENIFLDLGKKIPLQKNIMYLAASSALLTSKEILSGGLSLLFGNFEVIEVAPFDILTSSKFIKETLGLEINETYRKFLIFISGGNPFYLDTICRQLNFEAAKNNSGLISEEIFIKTFHDLLFDEWGILHQKFENLFHAISPPKERPEYADMLSSIISGNNKTKIIAENLSKKEKIIQQRMRSFCENGIIVKNADSFCIRDKLFVFWFASVYMPKHSFEYYSQESLANLFKENLVGTLNNFSLVLGKSVKDRIMDLFNLFANDTVRFERKKFILSRFKEVKTIETESTSFDLVVSAKAYDGAWLIAVKNGALSEKDVADFVCDCRKNKNLAFQKRLIISLATIDTNAKLKALEEKIITWDNIELNSIFELYNQPTIFTETKILR